MFNRKVREEGAKGAKGLHAINIINSLPSSNNQQVLKARPKSKDLLQKYDFSAFFAPSLRPSRLKLNK